VLCGEAVKAEAWKPHELIHPTAPDVVARGAGRLNMRVECVECARPRIGIAPVHLNVDHGSLARQLG
jgi:hypothetical protein